MNMQVRIDGPGDLSAVFHGRPNQPPLPNQWRGLLYATLGLFLLLFVLAVCVPIGGAVIGGGQVGVESRVKRIAHPLGGVVAEVPVVNGEHVEAGQLLLRLDDHVSGADATYTRLSVEQMLAQRARLDAEQMGRGAISFPPELANSTSPTAREAMANERHLFAIRRAEEGQLRAELIARIGQYKQSIRGIDAQIEALRSESRLIGQSPPLRLRGAFQPLPLAACQDQIYGWTRTAHGAEPFSAGAHGDGAIYSRPLPPRIDG